MKICIISFNTSCLKRAISVSADRPPLPMTSGIVNLRSKPCPYGDEMYKPKHCRYMIPTCKQIWSQWCLFSIHRHPRASYWDVRTYASISGSMCGDVGTVRDVGTMCGISVHVSNQFQNQCRPYCRSLRCVHPIPEGFLVRLHRHRPTLQPQQCIWGTLSALTVCEWSQRYCSTCTSYNGKPQVRAPTTLRPKLLQHCHHYTHDSNGGTQNTQPPDPTSSNLTKEVIHYSHMTPGDECKMGSVKCMITSPSSRQMSTSKCIHHTREISAGNAPYISLLNHLFGGGCIPFEAQVVSIRYIVYDSIFLIFYSSTVYACQRRKKPANFVPTKNMPVVFPHSLLFIPCPMSVKSTIQSHILVDSNEYISQNQPNVAWMQPTIDFKAQLKISNSHSVVNCMFKDKKERGKSASNRGQSAHGIKMREITCANLAFHC